MTGPIDVTPALAAPAPWLLEGRALVCPAFDRKAQAPGLLVVARYTASPVGEYDELLWIPRAFPPFAVADALVSSEASVAWGLRNWGIRKRLGLFLCDDDGARWTVRVAPVGSSRPIVYVATEAHGPRLPLRSRLLPAALRRFDQPCDERRYRFAPNVSAMVHVARVTDAQVGGDDFPELDLRSAFRLDELRLLLPAATIT